jgi:hypothetical protein
MPSRETLRPATNVPVVVTLDNPRGRECNSRYNGIEYSYQIQHRGVPSIVYLPLEAANQISRLDLQGGDQMEILKSNQQGRDSFEIRRIPDPHGEPPATNGREVRVLAPARPQQQPSPRQPQAQPMPAPSQSPQLADAVWYEKVFTRCLEVSLGANMAVHQEAVKRGFPIEPPLWDDIRTMANTLFINLNDSGELRRMRERRS